MSTQAIWDAFHQGLFRFIIARVNNRADAEDILQTVFLKIHHHTGQLQEQERLAGWVFRIASNAITDHHRAKRKHVGYEPDTAELADVTMDEDETMEIFSACVRGFVQILDTPYREAIVLTEFEGMTQAEAAKHVGMSVSGMKSRVQRGRQQLKGLIEACCHVDADIHGNIMSYDVRPYCGSCIAE